MPRTQPSKSCSIIFVMGVRDSQLPCNKFSKVATRYFSNSQRFVTMRVITARCNCVALIEYWVT